MRTLSCFTMSLCAPRSRVGKRPGERAATDAALTWHSCRPYADQCAAHIKARESRSCAPHSVATRQLAWWSTTAEQWSPCTCPRSPRPQAAPAGGVQRRRRAVARCTPARFCVAPSPWAPAPLPALGPSPRVRRAPSCPLPEAVLWCVTQRVWRGQHSKRLCVERRLQGACGSLFSCLSPPPAAQTVHANLFERAARVFRSYANAILTSAEARWGPLGGVPGRTGLGPTDALVRFVWVARTRRRCWTRL